jgi:hypothetical protein
MSILPTNIVLPNSASSGRTTRTDSNRQLKSASLRSRSGFGAVAQARSLPREPRQPLLASLPGRLDQGRLGGVPGTDLSLDRPRTHALIDLHEDKVRVEGDLPLPGHNVFGEDPYADLERARADVLDAGPQDGDPTHLHRVEEVDVVHGAEDHRAPRDP